MRTSTGGPRGDRGEDTELRGDIVDEGDKAISEGDRGHVTDGGRVAWIWIGGGRTTWRYCVGEGGTMISSSSSSSTNREKRRCMVSVKATKENFRTVRVFRN
jgi:hypothetical protein